MMGRCELQGVRGGGLLDKWEDIFYLDRGTLEQSDYEEGLDKREVILVSL